MTLVYLLIFHGDHMDEMFKNSFETIQGGDYYLSGLPGVHEHVPFSKLVDRDWPDYFNETDINGCPPINHQRWIDVENTEVKDVVDVKVTAANHHAWIDAMNEQYSHHVKPQVIVIQVWHVTHLNLPVMQSMTNKRINPNLEHIIPTNIPQLSRDYLGEDQIKKLTGRWWTCGDKG